MEDDDLMLGMFSIPDESSVNPRKYYDKLLASCQEHAHLADGEAVVDFLFVRDTIEMKGREILGSVHLPSVQGQLKNVFIWMIVNTFGRLPHFLVTLDKSYWNSCDERHQEILIYHEMCHMIHKENKDGELRFDMYGDPVWGIRGHDVEEFIQTVARYGAYSDDIREFINAAQKSGK